jgi:uncharacterized glyoxalase superfamily protein PhnB
MPKCYSAAPTFLVAEVGATARWYEKHLGFCASFFPKAEPYVFASLRRDDIEIMLLRIREYQKPDVSRLRPEGLWDAYIRMKGVHEFYESARGGVSIQMDLRKQPYGDWEFEVRDPNGYVLVFSELKKD